MRRTRSTRLTSDACAATKLALDAIQASTDTFPPLKSVVSAVIVILELSEIETLFKEIEKFFNGLEKESRWERFARQDPNKIQVEKYGRLLDEAMLNFSINLELSIHRLHVESSAVDQRRHTALLVSNRKRHAADRTRHSAVLAVLQMSESERLQPYTNTR
ncbi:hypothetical protein B0H19DRAFT_1277587 [Mycena capillaripes]|nr:hypothetical protein B0H19DRAFT_1277587 [Mycena capillaripes]